VCVCADELRKRDRKREKYNEIRMRNVKKVRGTRRASKRERESHRVSDTTRN
jgi:hypothetical protein